MVVPVDVAAASNLAVAAAVPRAAAAAVNYQFQALSHSTVDAADLAQSAELAASVRQNETADYFEDFGDAVPRPLVFATAGEAAEVSLPPDEVHLPLFRRLSDRW